MYKRQQPKRGVILLIVLGMLAMFALIAITFVLLSGHARRSAVSQAKVDQADNPPDRLNDNVLMQVLRGSNNPASVLGPHGLLEDLYGNQGSLRLSNGLDDDYDGSIDEADEANLQYGIFNNTKVKEPPSPVTLPIANLLQNINDQLFELVLAIHDPTVPGNGVAIDAIANGDSTLPHVGCVLIMLNGPAGGMSTRIVGYRSVDMGPYTIIYAQLLAFDKISTADVIAQINNYVANVGPISFTINGAPFSGTGFGYDPTAGAAGAETEPLLRAADPTVNNQPFALLPNNQTFTPKTTVPQYTDPAGPGGANEDYDAPDYQNMLLAMMVPQPGVTPNVAIPIPSLHRPSLVNYWFHQLDSLITWPTGVTTAQDKWQVFINPIEKSDGTAWPWTDATSQPFLINLKRRIILRPLAEDHPDFTGSNSDPNVMGMYINAANAVVPQFNWDVDNDGDGINDSIWVDVGLPVRTMRDGRQYKPLAAILCVDMDGRLNLNAHGSLAQIALHRDIVPPYPPISTDPRETLLTSNIAADCTNILTDIPHGQGIGPAEINLSPLFADPQEYRNLLRGDAASNTQGRYGRAMEGDTTDLSLPLVGNIIYPASNPPQSPLAMNQRIGYPYAYDSRLIPTPIYETRSYGTPVDLHGSVVVGLDLRGQPLYEPVDAYKTVMPTETLPRRAWRQCSNPYDLNLSNSAQGVTRTSSHDTPFSVAELEAILRPYDHDGTMLPERLATLAPALADHRFEVTTESWSIPCPAVAIPPELRNTGGGGIHKASSFVDLLRAKDQAMNADTMRQLVGPELLSGLKMDLNRPFGNGRDDNGNGVIDEGLNGIDDNGNGSIDELAENEEIDGFYQVDSSGVDLAMTPPCDIVQNTDVNGDGNVNATDVSLARQLYARHLYVMMLLLMNHDGTDQNVAREVAQWAVNIVDFRDRDSIMTGFEYDVNPFDGWNVDGDLSTDATGAPIPPGTNNPNVVWGCERPEMLITETLAFHDRRTEDRGAGGTVNASSDDDFDQRYKPEGSLFVELYNPWAGGEPVAGEFSYDRSANTLVSGVILNQTTPAVAGSHPVWRLAIVAKTDVNKDPDDPANPITFERSVYFVDLSSIPTFNPTDDGQRYYPSSALPSPAPAEIVLPGQYAVIGPADTTYIGCSMGDFKNATTRRIELGVSAPVSVIHNRYDQADTSDFPNANSVQQTPLAVVVDSPRRLSVSEPVGGYDAYTNATNTAYEPELDKPRDALGADSTELMVTETTEAFRAIHLQRLANPVAAYDAHKNPYLTIDSMPIAITAFNGQSATDDPGAGDGSKVKFHSRQRGDSGTLGADMNIWSPIDYNNVAGDPDYAQNKIFMHHFDVFLRHTLGYLNDPFHFEKADDTDPTVFTVGWSASSKLDMNGDDDFDDPVDVPANVPQSYYGAPRDSDLKLNRTFPWITWLNRPYLSEMELLQVPRVRSSRLLGQFSMSGGVTYTDDTDETDESEVLKTPFKHTINFFRDADAVDDNPTNWKRHRLLEYVRVPSPFVGTELQGEPTTFSAGTHDFRPPFNHISKRRDPGRVNLNTISSQAVWNGVAGEFNGPAWNDLRQSRRGYGVKLDQFKLDDNLPTRFANPFRSFAGKYMVPTQDLQDKVVSEINATLLRPTVNADASLFENDTLFQFTSTLPINNTDRNPYFRYQELNRLASTTTNRSNVYAVWVTVGYFEVSPRPTNRQYYDTASGGMMPWTPDMYAKVYPDGFQLGQELGSDTGDITRHRSFYMIDRSIPVGFRRGEDLNAEDAILLRRFIE